MHLILAEFGPHRQNAGGAKLAHRLDPALRTAVATWQDELTLILVGDVDSIAECEREAEEFLPSSRVLAITVDPSVFFDPKHPRCHWRANDYFKVWGLSRVPKGDVGIALDADMAIVNPQAAATAATLGRQFRLCIASNARGLVRVDAASQCDGGPCPPGHEYGPALAGCPIIAEGKSPLFDPGRLLDRYLTGMREEPCRGPLAMYRAMVASGDQPPLILPPQWCVTSGLQLIAHPIIAHVGHADVREHFKGRY